MSSSGNWPHRQNTAASRNWETRTAIRRQRRRGLASLLDIDERLQRLAMAIGVALLIAVGLWIWNGRQAGAKDTPELTQVVSGAPASIPAPPTSAPTTLPTTTPATSSATIIRLGGGPGMLHESPGFRTPVLSVILQEGDAVELLGREAQDADGNTWVLVAFGESVGWSPENNVQVGSN
jgi:hypothetical protein